MGGWSGWADGGAQKTSGRAALSERDVCVGPGSIISAQDHRPRAIIRCRPPSRPARRALGTTCRLFRTLVRSCKCRRFDSCVAGARRCRAEPTSTPSSVPAIGRLCGGTKRPNTKVEISRRCSTRAARWVTPLCLCASALVSAFGTRRATSRHERIATDPVTLLRRSGRYSAACARNGRKCRHRLESERQAAEAGSDGTARGRGWTCLGHRRSSNPAAAR